MATRLFTQKTAPGDLLDPVDSSERAVDSVFSRRGRELAAFLLFASASFLLLALLTYRRSPIDPLVEGSNWMGPVGATLAAWLAQGFGIVALLVPLELVLVGLPLFRGQEIGPWGLRVAGDLLVAIVTSSLVQVLWPEATCFGQMQAAGNVGGLFGELMRGMFSTIGSLLVGITAIGLVLLGRSAFSFIQWCQRVADTTLRVYAWLCAWSNRLVNAWLEARRLNRQAAPAASAPAPAIVSTHLSEQAIIAELAPDDDWIPFEHTGQPPVAVMESLRVGLAAATASLRETETPIAPLVVQRIAVENDETVAGERAKPKARIVLSKERAKPAASDEEEVDEDEEEVDEDEEEVDEDEEEVDEDEEEVDEDEEEVDEDEEEVDEDNVPAADRTRLARGGAPAGACSTGSSTTDAAKAQPFVSEGPPPASKAPARSVVNPPKRRRAFRLPATDLLEKASGNEPKIDKDRVLQHAERLEKTLLDYGVLGTVEEIHPGPTVTTYEYAPQAGTKVSKVAGLADDLALGLSRKVRIIAPIPGKSRIGFEIPNDQRIPVNLRELVDDPRFAALAEKVPLPVVLGRDIVGSPFYADLASMPHVIVAGATGAGKSVGLNVMLASLLFKRTPDELRMLMIDPKVVELAPFDKIPHLLLPVVTDMKQANLALKWAVDEMERRYQLFATAGTKNIGTYNRWAERIASGELPRPPQTTVEAMTHDGAVMTVPASPDGDDGGAPLPGKLPYIVIVIDEFADLMMQQGKEVEASVARLAQKARAAGLHVVLATQRPSVDVITGMIKANFPSRMAYLVAQRVDSRTILDEQGAEHLLGRGDMLVKLNGSTDVRRVQCPFVSEDEVSALTDYLRTQGQPQYHEAILQSADEEGGDDEGESLDVRFEEAVRIVAETGRCSTSWLQRKMTIGYNRAAKIVEAMEHRGMVGPPNGAKDREVLILAH